MNAMETLLSVCIGLGLSAACGFRVFVPLAMVSLAALTGHLELSPGFAWLGSYAAAVAFTVATVVEIAAYYVPWLDHALDSLASPAAVIAGTVVSASVMTDVSPFLKWTLAAIAGGGMAGAVQSLTVLARGVSTFGTGGLANPVLASVEWMGALGTGLVALTLPFLAATAAVVAVVAVGGWWIARARRERRFGVAAGPV
jgi:hypothetical protein